MCNLVYLSRAREAIVGIGNGFVAVEIPFTPRAKRILDLAWEQAKELGHNYFGSEHILLALTIEENSSAARVMKKLRVPVQYCVRQF
jgi:ATP-dependent Clp protease ATP-binding subunit ClpC